MSHLLRLNFYFDVIQLLLNVIRVKFSKIAFFVADVRVRQHRVGDGVHLEHHGALPGETLGHLLGNQGQCGQGLDVHHEGRHHQHVAPGHHHGHPASHGIQQICL